MPKVLILQGPNLNLLGHREPEIYGKITLQEIHDNCQKQAQLAGIELDCFQSNSEAELIHKIHQSKSGSKESKAEQVDFIIINPAGLTHTSVVLRDALLGVGLPLIEIHLSNIFRREPFRAHSYFSDIAIGVITGLGEQGYEFALSYAIQYLTR